MTRTRKLPLIVAAIVAVALAVGAGLAARTPADVRADYTAVVDADHRMATETNDQLKFSDAMLAFSQRETFTSRHGRAGWRIGGDNHLVAPPWRTRTAVGLGAAAAILALLTARAALRRRSAATGEPAGQSDAVADG